MADFYVDAYEGSDANAGTSRATAWATLTKLETEMLAANVDSGDTVYFIPGQSFTWDAASEGTLFFEDGITFKTITRGESVEFVGTGTTPFRIRQPGCTFEDIVFNGSDSGSCIDTATPAASTVTMTRCTVKNAAGIGLQQQSGGSTTIDSVFNLTDCTFADNGTNGANLTGCHNSTIRNCTFSGNGTVGLRIQSSGTGVLVTGCTAHSNGSNGIGVDTPQTGGGAEVVEYCTVYENANTNDDTSGIKTFSTGTIIRFNTVYDNGLQQSINHGIQLETGSDACQCYYNLCYGNLTSGISFTNTNHVIYNNTCVGNGDTGIATFSTAITGCTVKNNIMARNTNYSFRSHGTVTITTLDLDRNLHVQADGSFSARYNGTDYTSFSTFQSTVTQEAYGLTADPRFVNVDGDEYRLHYNSPAKSRAADVSLSTDLVGAAINQGSGIDLGCFEFTGDMRGTN